MALQVSRNNKDILRYTKFLKVIASLSKLYSTSPNPFIQYRTAENIFCYSFQGQNLSRSDIAYDAKVGKNCFGIKTFIDGASWQKVAEFNKESSTIGKLTGKKQIERVAELRNKRINFAERLHNDGGGAFYHCITRGASVLYVFEEPYTEIDIKNIEVMDSPNKNIIFQDGKNEYKYYHPKSTLFKKFERDDSALKVPVTILEDPLETLARLLKSELRIEESPSAVEKEYLSSIGVRAVDLFGASPFAGEEYVILPLYSTKGKGKEVPERSGLNQWNARGREREVGEVYIPVPSQIHHLFPGFFPGRDTTWELTTPDNQVLSAKLCQQGSKALMTNPNTALSQWLLRGALGLEEGEVLTYEKLEDVGIDSVRITKFSEGKFRIDFAKLGSYEDFIVDSMTG